MDRDSYSHTTVDIDNACLQDFKKLAMFLPADVSILASYQSAPYGTSISFWSISIYFKLDTL